MIRIADKSVDGWKVVDEYIMISDELASGSEGEKRLKRAKEAASWKRKQDTEGRRGSDKKLKGTLSSPDQQLFRGDITLFMHFCIHCVFCVVRFLLCFQVGGGGGTLRIL